MEFTETTSHLDDSRMWQFIVARRELELVDIDWKKYRELMDGEVSDRLYALHLLAEAVEALHDLPAA